MIRILRYFKHLAVTVLALLVVAVIVGLNIGAAVHYTDDPTGLPLNLEGPHVFFKNDSTLDINYIMGNKEDGFYLDQQKHSIKTAIKATCFFPLDSSSFEFTISAGFEIPATVYDDDSPILAISDIEGGYRTFRDFLIHSNVIDKELSWTFGKGHLVLLGDFVDRGWSVTQVLWFIYKLEQDAAKHGGTVHFILGNHELKNMQGHHQATADRYYAAAAVLGKHVDNLYDSNSFIGRWMASKNTVEKINGNLFVHGGLHPDLTKSDFSLEKINEIIRNHYDHFYLSEPGESAEQLILSNTTGVAWYRGYFKEDLKQDQINQTLDHFGARRVIVGHTLQSEITSLFEGKVIGIDVKHPKDYQKYWPFHESEGLLISGDHVYRVLHDGSKELL
ncbi:hypothetical protein SYJ56_24520 [Algoriphagus sp. D3-2-R+10]|uniref:metallophosphoesterase n=1 Tax=Algoriphagus aurantiacus TaxID=3103948 RepID=UPI002B3A674E|nr:metallophosphoesterase [Algoriphagus sp. D3-2-R+10]MEB2778496.1 hypothetical protein [Algoriphagus sp. D3-2-R+10]